MWIRRKEHFRNASGAPERSKVAATVYYLPDTAEPPPARGWDERCPHCGAPIRVSKPARGGTAISEVLPGGALIPHPCFDRLRANRPSDATLACSAGRRTDPPTDHSVAPHRSNSTPRLKSVKFIPRKANHPLDSHAYR